MSIKRKIIIGLTILFDFISVSVIVALCFCIMKLISDVVIITVIDIDVLPIIIFALIMSLCIGVSLIHIICNFGRNLIIKFNKKILTEDEYDNIFKER